MLNRFTIMGNGDKLTYFLGRLKYDFACTIIKGKHLNSVLIFKYALEIFSYVSYRYFRCLKIRKTVFLGFARNDY